jgi:hypothetical protein
MARPETVIPIFSPLEMGARAAVEVRVHHLHFGKHGMTSAANKNAPSSPSTPSSPSPTPSPEADQFIVESILPAHELHLVAGPSGSGKTSLVFQTIDDWARTIPVFGYESYPRPFCYVSCDRSLRATDRTLRRIGAKIEVPRISLVDSLIANDFSSVLKAARARVKDVEVLFIDAIAALCPSGKINDYGAVRSMLTGISRTCQREKVTVVGMAHSTKVKEGEKFLNPRQRVLGSVAWGGFSDTMILIEPDNPEDPADASRIVTLLPRNAPAETILYHFTPSGVLVPTNRDTEDFILDAWLRRQIPGPNEYTTASIVGIAEEAKLSRSSAVRWIRTKVSDGLLEKVRHGIYSVKSIH